MCNRVETEKIINAKIGGRRSIDMDKMAFNPLFIGIKKVEDPFLLMEYTKETSRLEFNKWYEDSGFYNQEIKLKNLMRSYNKRSIR